MTKKDTDKGLIQRVADTHRLGMAKVLRNVANQDWGWFSREDERMHLQTIGAKANR